MTEIDKYELKKIQGGGLSIWGAISIVAGVIFAIGVIDGFVRPLKCN